MDAEIRLLMAMDYFGVAVFAFSGGLVAARKEMDLLGFLVLGTVTGVGGGTLRDLLLGLTPVFWITRPGYLAICGAAALTAFVLAPRFAPRRALLWSDAMGLGAFSVLGTQVALSVGVHSAIAILMGMVTASFGGLVRDVLSGEVPLILRREIYASAALVGSVIYVLLDRLQMGTAAAALAAAAVTVTVRAVAFHKGLGLPRRRAYDAAQRPQ